MFAAVLRPREGRAKIAPTLPATVGLCRRGKLMTVLHCDLGRYKVYRSHILHIVIRRCLHLTRLFLETSRKCTVESGRRD